ncbi:MAG: efflux RND transporter permease subunit [Verrucomicrobiales bacterium]|nr:efflux RND transporter permease subunit [Verrucomicrobiales bacterium]
MKSSRLIGLFFDNRYLLTLLMIVTLVAGLSAINGLPRLEDPVITNRNPIVITVFPGASAERVEALVTEKIEETLDEVDAIKNYDSTSRAGLSIFSIQLEDSVTKETVEPIHSEIRDALAEASATFPPEALPPFYDDNRNPVAYTLLVALRWEESEKGSDSLGILSRQAEELADRLRRVSGTELVRLYGQPAEEIQVTVRPNELAARGLTPRDVANALQRADVKIPAGQLRGDSADLLVEVTGQLDTLDRVREVIVQQASDGLATVRVGDLADVSRTWQDPPSQIAKTEGQRAIYVAARVAEDQRVDLWDSKANEVLTEFTGEIGNAIAVDTLFRQSDYTTARLGELTGNLILGSLVVVLVIFFTMGWRRSLIVSSALPLTAAATLFVVSMQGGKLHQMSIFGMIIALGLLIDTAIVITDEVRKFLAKGKNRREAVIAALRHLFVPLLSSTLTSVLAFMPILLLPGSAGDFVGSIGGSVIIAISASFLLSLTAIAAMAGIFSQAPGKEKKKPLLPRWMREGVEARWFSLGMKKIIHTSVRFPIVGLGLGAAIPVAGFLLAQTLGSQFFPRTDRDMFTVEISLPTVTTIEKTIEFADRAEALIREHEGIERVHWLAGASFPPVYYNLIEGRDNSSEYVMGVIDADRFETVNELVPRLQEQLDRAFPEALVQVKKFAQGPPANADVEFRIQGPSFATLQSLGDEVQRRLGEHPDIIHAESTLTRGEPKLYFETNEAEARAAGIDPSAVADQLQTNLEGLPGGSVIEAVEEMPVRVRVPDAGRDRIDVIADLRIVGRDGAQVPLRAIGEFQMRPETGVITRRNGERVNSVRGYAATGTLPIDITNEILADLEASEFSLPAGYRLDLGGEAENQGDAVGNLLLYLPVIVTVTIAILILSFKSVRIASILLTTAFLSVGYGLFATWVMQFPVSFNTILGCIGLVGLAFNDNIVSLAAIYSNRKARVGDVEAITEEILGCGRHLISTTLTTIGSFLPLLILIGGQFWPPLAIVLAGGVGGATFLAAVFTPAAYRLIAARKYRKKAEKEATESLPEGAAPAMG